MRLRGAAAVLNPEVQRTGHARNTLIVSRDAARILLREGQRMPKGSHKSISRISRIKGQPLTLHWRPKGKRSKPICKKAKVLQGKEVKRALNRANDFGIKRNSVSSAPIGQ